MNAITTDTYSHDPRFTSNPSTGRLAINGLAPRKSAVLSRRELRDLIADLLG